MFTLASSCLTSSNLPWFMDLTQWTRFLCNIVLTSSDFTFATRHIHTEHSFCFDSAFSFFLELFLCFSPVAYWAPTNLGSSSFSVISFCLFILFMGFLRQKFWNCFAIPFFSGPHFVSTLHRYPSILDDPTGHASLFHCQTRLWPIWSVWLVFCGCGSHFHCPLMDEDKRLVDTSWWEGLAVGESGFFSGGQGHTQ